MQDDTFVGHVRRIDLESKSDYLGPHIYAHVFLISDDGKENVDVYTDDPRFEAAMLKAFSLDTTARPPYVEVTFAVLKETGTKKVVRVAMERKAE